MVSFRHFPAESSVLLGYLESSNHNQCPAPQSLALIWPLSPQAALIVHLWDRHDSKWADFSITPHNRDTLKERYTNLHTPPPLGRIPLAGFFENVFSGPPIPKRSDVFFPSPFLLIPSSIWAWWGYLWGRWRRFQSLQIRGSGPDLPVRHSSWNEE